MVRYAILWIPVLVEYVPEIINENPAPVELSDVPGLPSCHLRCSTDKLTKNFTLYYRLGNDSQENKIEFTHLESTQSGFISYKLEFDDTNDHLTENLQTSIHHSVYHYVKGLFHKHAFHDEECDSLLKGFCSHERLKWSDNGVPKKVFTHYIREYIEKLTESYSTLSAQLAFLQDIVNVKRQYRTGVNKSQQLKKDCFRVTGEAKYAIALLRMSRFTVKSKVYCSLSDSLIRLEMLREQCVDAYNTINNTYNNRLGRIGIWVGAIGIAITATLEAVHTCTVDNETPKKQLILLDRLVKQNDSEIRELTNRADSLAEQNERVLRSLEKIVNE